ncbi:PQQ-binding-like beta-propeller repeat protein [Streptomyces sp. NPDC005897]|uniref:PQQ-binding-like beta-propeller repeat protein n=1 Tax=Streptomyces sp. NPDC005897 TaxID=3157081 RepID=UPI0033F94468
MDAETNTVRWTYLEKDLRSIRARGDLVYVLRDSLFEPELIALRVAGGREAWTSGVLSRNPHRPPRPFDAPAAIELEDVQGMFTVSDDVICLFTYAPYTLGWERRATSDPPWRAYAFDSRTGKELWFYEGRTAEVIAVDDAGGRIAVASSSRDSGVPGTDQYAQDDPLVVLKASDGAVERQIARGARRPQAHPGAGAEGVGGGRRGPVVRDGVLLNWLDAGTLQALDLADGGRQLWRTSFDAIARCPPAIGGDMAYVTAGQVCRALGLRTGTVLKEWPVDEAVTWLAADDKGWYAVVGTSSLRAVNAP